MVSKYMAVERAGAVGSAGHEPFGVARMETVKYGEDTRSSHHLARK
jgi:hypothetical protein